MKKLARNLAAIIVALFAANAAFAFGLPSLGTVDTVGIDLRSWHDRGDYNNNTPGAYVITDKMWAAGAYYNSHRKMSVWAGYQFDWKYGGVLVGGVTGYPKYAVLPMVAPSVKLPYNFRVTIVPSVIKHRGATALHLTWEFKL